MKHQKMDVEHFSHHHVLVALKPDQGEEINCNGCERLIHEPFRGCLSCNYWVHDDCLNTPRFIHHPSHPDHSLTLLPTPTYPARSFSCDACGSAGNAFSFCCAQCELDLHVHCANLPTNLILEQHPHELKLIFGSPYEDKGAEYGCDLCHGRMQPGNWLYYCPECDFGTHIDCATGGHGESNAAQRKTYQENPRASTGKESNRSEADLEEELFETARNIRIAALSRKMILESVDPDYDRPRKYYYY